jgi:hypothetical protein
LLTWIGKAFSRLERSVRTFTVGDRVKLKRTCNVGKVYEITPTEVWVQFDGCDELHCFDSLEAKRELRHVA